MRAPHAAPLAPSLIALTGLTGLTALAALAACNASTIVVGELQDVTAFKAIPNRKLDLLFVVDDSNGMLDLQLALGQRLPRMIDLLSRLDGGLPDLHVGVISSDMGTLASSSPTPAPPIGVVGQGGCAGAGLDGALQARSAALSARYLSDVAAPDGSRVRNYTGALPDVLAQLVTLGAGGCGFEQPLAATRRALANPLNAGFLREDANLAVVLISDEDDCSALDPTLFGPESPALGPLQSFRCTRFGVVCDPDDLAPGPKTGCAPRAASLLVEDVQPFVDALLAAKPDPRMVTAAAIAGDPEPFALELRTPPGGGTPELALAHSCQLQGGSGGEVADPAVRLAAFVDAFPGSQLASICSADLDPAVTAASGALRRLVGEPCLDAPLADASPAPGLQPACEVVDVRDSAPGRARALPGCAAGAADCFEIVSDEIACPGTPDHLRVQLRRATEVTDDTWSHVRCQLHR